MRPAGSSSLSDRIQTVDGLRGLAILLVMVYHFKLFAIKTAPIGWEVVYRNLVNVGWAGVDLFFVLSGFLITGILFRSREQPNYYRVFYARRTVRIFPLYYISLAVLFGLVPLTLNYFHAADVIRSLRDPMSQLFAWLYILNWRVGFLGFGVASGLIHHFWSLSVEEQFYLVWPFIVRNLGSRRALIRLCLVVIVVALLLRVVFFFSGLGTAAYVLTICRVDSLAVGALVSLTAADKGDWNRLVPRAPLITGASALLLGLLFYVAGEPAFENPWIGTLGISLLAFFFGGFLVLALVAGDQSVFSKVVASSVLRFFGKYSYCLYVAHQPLIQMLAKAVLTGDRMTALLHNRIAGIASVYAIAFAVTIAVALASWHLVEKHFLKLKDLAYFSHSPGAA